MKYLYLHGLGQTPESWEPVVRGMKQREDILCPSLWDFCCGAEIRYENLYRGFSQYCESIGEPIALCGLSLGGILALQYGIEHPEKVTSMAIIGTPCRMPKGMLKVQNAIFSIMPNQAFMQMGMKKQEVIRLSESMMNLNFHQDLYKVVCPVLVVCGERDRANKRNSLELKRKLPRAKGVLIKEAGHEVNMDAPERLGKVLESFFTGSSSEKE